MTASLQASLFYRPADKPDICAKRHRGNRNSEAANGRVHFHKKPIREQVWELIRSADEYGMTLKEVAKVMQKPLHALSGRISELRADGRVRDTGTNREHCAVLVAIVRQS